jgi:riboflavin synthase
MFTGLIEEVGVVASMRPAGGGASLQVRAPRLALGSEIGSSIAVNGCCLTTTVNRDHDFSFDLLEETLARTNLGTLRPGSRVNLERALAANGRLGGHFVQGHIDTTARVIEFSASGPDHRLEVELPPAFARYAAAKGSVALNGVSLTIAELRAESFVVWIIPHTFRETNFATLQPNDFLNVEFDILAKYVERMLPGI